MTTYPNIALTSKARSGKDTVAKYLVEEYDYAKLAFADPLRELVEKINPLLMEDDLWGEYRYVEQLEREGYEALKDRMPEARRLLQATGVAVREVLGEQVWIDVLWDRVAKLDRRQPYVITDMRFDNEFAFARVMDMTTARVLRPGAMGDDHVSETSMDAWRLDYTINNDGTLDDLRAQVDALVWSNSRTLDKSKGAA